MDFPNIIGPSGPIKIDALISVIKTHLNTLETSITSLETYLATGPRVFQPAAIKIGTSQAADVLMQQPLIILNEGALITVAASEIDISGLAGTATAVAASKKYRCLLTAALADGTINFVQGEEVVSTATPVTPAATTGTIGFGYVEITTSGETTFGTTALTSIATFHDLITPLS